MPSGGIPAVDHRYAPSHRILLQMMIMSMQHQVNPASVQEIDQRGAIDESGHGGVEPPHARGDLLLRLELVVEDNDPESVFQPGMGEDRRGGIEIDPSIGAGAVSADLRQHAVGFEDDEGCPLAQELDEGVRDGGIARQGEDALEGLAEEGVEPVQVRLVLPPAVAVETGGGAREAAPSGVEVAAGIKIPEKEGKKVMVAGDDRQPVRVVTAAPEQQTAQGGELLAAAALAEVSADHHMVGSARGELAEALFDEGITLRGDPPVQIGEVDDFHGVVRRAA